MRYTKFIIENYRGITGPLEVDIKNNSLMPIIGVNECGKTTILHAIFAFDLYNDNLNKSRHQKDISNLYLIDPPDPKVTAEVQWCLLDLKSIIRQLERKKEGIDKQIVDYKNIINDFPLTIQIRRNLKNKRYYIDNNLFKHKNLNNLIAKYIISRLPYILYFDDFRDSVDETIEIDEKQRNKTSGWLSIIEQLFRKTDKILSVFDLPSLEQRRRKSVLAKVEKNLNKTLTQEWQNFRLDDCDALNISIDYDEKVSDDTKRCFVKLEVVEKDSNDDEHFFFISDRSKGFFWFFNFVMKLEFNPKVAGSSGYDAIYLLDEPGSYLHASAQSKLCKKLKELSSKNKVIYCTHSHYLLNPDVIPINGIRIAEKDGKGNIDLISIHEYKGNINEKITAFQPLLDALQIKPFLLDLYQDNVIITEGIVDRYIIDMFKGD